MITYKGSICLVTGATSGNGEAVAKLLLRQGAKMVYALGRNQTKLRELEALGAVPEYCELGSFTHIDAVIYQVLQGPRLDHIFHLAGNALVGHPDADQRDNFYRTDLLGPLRLIQALLQHMTPGGGVALVTSESVALGDIPEYRQYQKVKGDMIRWWVKARPAWGAQGISMTLISMGGVASDIWNRTEGMGPLTRFLVPKIFPSPDQCAQQIMADMAVGRPVSYPGRFGSLAPLDPKTGEYHPNPILKFAFTTATRIWAGLDNRTSV